MRNDARPIGSEFRNVAEHSDQTGDKDREPAEGARPPDRGRRSENARGSEKKLPMVSRDPADQPPPDQSER